MTGGISALSSASSNETCALQSAARQAALNRFTVETGRTKHIDRMQVNGYNKSVARSAAQNAKRQETPQITTAYGNPVKKVKKVSTTAAPNSITQYENAKGGIDRNFYGADGKQTKQISNNDHGHKKVLLVHMGSMLTG